MQKADKDDAIRLITGGPGSGKSSFAKMFAAQQAEREEISVLYIPLNWFKLTDDLVKAVGDFAAFHFLDNPLDPRNDKTRLLIVFDGLDKLSIEGTVVAIMTNNFVAQVCFLVSQYNLTQTQLQVLISGREAAVEASNVVFFKSHQLLYLLPYFVSREETKKYIDKQSLLEEDRRQDWWRLYGQAKGKDYCGLPVELARDNLIKITSQPLLNYFIALSFEREQAMFAKQTSLNQIYADLIDVFCERNYEETNSQHKATEKLNKEEFLAILEEIALACWHGDGRTTTVKEIEKRCNYSEVKDFLQLFQEGFYDSMDCIDNLLIAFYFRESGKMQEGEKLLSLPIRVLGNI